MNKDVIKDIIICIVLAIVIIFEIIFGVNTLKSKWSTDTTKIISGSSSYGQSIGLVETVFSWPEAPEPNAGGDIVSIDENRFQINGLTTNDSHNIQKNYVYYSAIDDHNASRFIQYEEVLDTAKVDQFHAALTSYFSGDAGAFVPLLSVNTTPEAIVAYQQNFTDGAIPMFYDDTTGNYFMLLDCVSSYYVLSCVDPFAVSDAKVTVHYASAADDPLTEHSWSTYEAGAIDNTRQQLMDSNSTLGSYTQSDIGQTYTDTAGNQYTGNSQIQSNNELYMSDADEQARAVLVSYGTKKFDEAGNAEDGSGSIDISSVTAMKSQWLLTQTQYSFTDNGITINGLSGSRSSSSFEVSGNATNTIRSSRPWVLCVKFMGEDNKLLGVKVIDNRSNPIPADGVSYFTVNLDSSDDIVFSDIVAIQFAVH